MKLLLTLTTLFVFISPISVFASRTDDIESYIHQTMEHWKVPGLAVGIIKNGKVVYMKGFGVRTKGQPERVDSNTLFRIASVSKTFAAALVGTFVDEGKLNWDDPIVHHLPELYVHDSPVLPKITLKHVLSNSTGLPRHTFTHLLDADTPFDEILPQLDVIKPKCSPGACYTYQNVAYSLSGRVCESLFGKSYSELLKERIFTPLGMHQSSASCEEFKESKNKAMPHREQKGGYSPLDYNCRYYDVGPAAGINTTLSDLMIWAHEVLSTHSTLLSAKTANEILSPAIETPDEIHRWNLHWRKTRLKKAEYGLGWRLFDYSGTPMLYHGGGLQGYSAVLALLPQQKTGIVVLANVGKSTVVDSIMARFIDAELGLDLIDYNEEKKKRLDNKNNKQ